MNIDSTPDVVAKAYDKTRRSLDVIIKASSIQETVPGSIKAFYSAEYGDSIHPVKRPRLEIEWTAPAVWSTRRSFVLEPGASTKVPWELPPGCPPDALVRGSVAADATAPFAPELTLPCLSAAPHPIPAGASLSIPILETWSPDVASPEHLEVRFRFTAPSGRSVAGPARYAGDFTYAGEIRPDELGLWSFAWSSRPDARFPAHSGGGWFTVVRGKDTGALTHALLSFADAALKDAAGVKGVVARKQNRFRLLALQSALRDVPGAADALRRIAAALPALE